MPRNAFYCFRTIKPGTNRVDNKSALTQTQTAASNINNPLFFSVEMETCLGEDRQVLFLRNPIVSFEESAKENLGRAILVAEKEASFITHLSRS